MKLFYDIIMCDFAILIPFIAVTHNFSFSFSFQSFLVIVEGMVNLFSIYLNNMRTLTFIIDCVLIS